MPARMTWNGDAAKRLIEAEMGRRLDTSAIVVENHAKVLISIDGTGVGPGDSLIYGANPSSPGEPPRVQTGRLRGSVAHEREGMVARVGTSVLYAKMLELGTVRMAARPWLRRALAEMSGAVRAILGRPMT